MVLGAMDSICTSSRVVVAACNAVYTPLLQYVKYKLYLFENIRLPAIVQTSSERSIYWLGTGTRCSLKAREGGWSRCSGARGAPSRSLPGRWVLRTTASARISASSSAMALCGSGGGKPAYVYELTSEAEDLFPKAYEPALGRLLDVLAERLGPEESEALLRSVGRRLVEGKTVTKDGLAPGSRQPPACEKPRCCFEVASADEVTQR